MINNHRESKVTEDKWNILVADFRNSLFRSSLLSTEPKHTKLFLDNNPNITEIDPVVIFRKLRELDLHRTKIHDLSPLFELGRLQDQLRHLNLSHTLISDLSHLRGLLRLQSLNISYCIHVQDLWPIWNMQNLEKLNIQHTRVSCLKSVPFHRLKYLNATHTRLEDLVPLANSNISELSLQGCKMIPEMGFSVLANLTNVEWLSLSGTKITVHAIEMWNCPLVWKLWLDDCPHLNDLPSFGLMDMVSEISLSNLVLNSLEPLRGLNLLKICLNGSTFPSLSPISGMDIEEIFLSGARFQVGPLDLPRLKALDISNTKGCCISILNVLHNSPIVHLDLSYTTIVNLWPITLSSRTLRVLLLSHTPVENITPISRCQNLKTLSLSYTKVKEHRSVIFWVAAKLIKLEEIYLEGTPLKDKVNSVLNESKRSRKMHEKREESNSEEGSPSGG